MPLAKKPLHIFLMVVALLTIVSAPLAHAQQAAEWTDVIGLDISGGTLTKTAPDGWGNAGAASTKVIPANTDGWVEWNIDQNNKQINIGLSMFNTDANYATNHYAIGFDGYGNVYTMRDGLTFGNAIQFGIGDLFRIGREGDQIKYYRNGIVIGSKLVAADVELLVDAAFASNGASLYNLTLSNSFVTPGTPATYTPVDWVDVIGMDVTGNPAFSTATSGWGNAGMASGKVIPANTDGWVEWRILQTNKNINIGLSMFNTDANYTTNQHAIGFDGYGNVYTMRDGLTFGNAIQFGIGDLFRIGREGDQIKYYRNGIVIGSKLVAADVELLVDAAFASNGGIAVQSNPVQQFRNAGDTGNLHTCRLGGCDWNGCHWESCVLDRY